MKVGKILLSITKRTFVSYGWLLQLVLLKPPIESGTNKFWKLNISAYGLCDASHSWYLSLKSVLLKTGATKSNCDDSVVFGNDQGKVQCSTCYHVDFCWGVNKTIWINNN